MDTQRTLLAGAVAGGCEAVATMPFEVTKTRLQLGHGPRGLQANMMDTVARAGPTGLYFGLQAQLVQVAAKGAIRFTAYERFKRLLGPSGSSFVAGTLAGLTEALMWVVPTERLKVLRTTELGGAAGTRGSGLLDAAAAVVRQQGVRGLWLGSGPTAARQALANGSRFLMFDRVKASLPAWVPAPAAIAGGLTGVASVLITNPVDVVKTQVQSVPVSGAGAGVSTVALVRGLIREEGVGVLCRGMGARVLKIGLGQAVIFGVYDAVRRRLL